MTLKGWLQATETKKVEMKTVLEVHGYIAAMSEGEEYDGKVDINASFLACPMYED